MQNFGLASKNSPKLTGSRKLSLPVFELLEILWRSISELLSVQHYFRFASLLRLCARSTNSCTSQPWLEPMISLTMNSPSAL
jgi:hypothetical protein